MPASDMVAMVGGQDTPLEDVLVPLSRASIFEIGYVIPTVSGVTSSPMYVKPGQVPPWIMRKGRISFLLQDVFVCQ